MKREVQIILTADEGKLLTDGEDYIKQIRLPETADEYIWHEITEEEYAEICAQNEPDPEII